MFAIHECNTEWHVICVSVAFLVKLVYGMDIICIRVLDPKSCLFYMLIFI